jgi:general secretion pathway protein N
MRHARAIAAFFAVLLGAAVIAGAAATAEQQDQSAAGLANPLAAQSLDQLSSTLERPLFSPSRRPPAPPPPPVAQAPPPPAPPPPPPNLVLFGVVMDGEGARAVVRSGADKKLVRAQIGDEIDGWKVSQIEGRKVVLSLDGRFATFKLFNDDRGKSEPGPASEVPGEPKNSRQQIEAQRAPAQAAAPQSGQSKKRRRSRE